MSKYDFEIDLSLNSSTGMILSKLRPGSTVLEFGCAAGRMTRYMKEQLGCRVYIVEYDKGAFQKAMQFAQDGICDDIQNYLWADRFGAIAFDAILFADVLEHLTRPEETLKRAAALLKEDGCMYVSIPNVTHNDIVLKLYQERFDYTQTGLLDDTHVHFWGLENLKQLGSSAGLTVRCIEGTHCAAGDTEQDLQLGGNRLLENILRERQAGETYQFVVTMDKGGAAEPVCTIAPPAVTSHIYLDTGKDFNAEECIAVASAYSGAGSYIAHYVIADAANIRRIRLDPVEFQGVIVRSVSICQNGAPLQLAVPNAVQTAAGPYLPGNDPMIVAQVQPDQGPITVDAEFVLPGTGYIHILEETAAANQTLLASAAQQHQQTLQVLHGEMAALHRTIGEQQKEIAGCGETIAQMEASNQQLQTDVCAYILLANQKEKLALTLEQQLQTTQQHLAATQQQLMATEQQRDEYIALAENRGQYIAEQERVLSYFRNLRVVRMRAFVVRVLRKIKRCVKKILGRVS